MKVVVIGPGAMGCLFGARLSLCGIQTVLIDHDAARAARLARTGIVIEGPQGTATAHPGVVTKVPAKADLTIPFVKAHCTENLDLPLTGPVLTLQNGLMGVEALCSMAGSARVLAGVTEERASLVDEGRVRHERSGLTTFGAWTSAAADAAVEALTRAGFQAQTTQAPGQGIWEKQAVSAGIEPLAAIMDVPIGRLLDIPEARQIMRDLVVEAVKVASTEGYRFDHSLIEQAEEICEKEGARSSAIIKDIRAGRTSEIDALSGDIVRRGQLAALPTPRTRVILQLVKALEQR